MKHILTISLLFIGLFCYGQKTTLTVKKQKQIEGLYYQRLNKRDYKYLRFEGDSVIVYFSTTKPYGKQSNYSYSDFVKASMKRNKTDYQISDSLLTFTFTYKNRNGDYRFEDYHCILDNEEKLIIKKGSTTKTVVIETYNLYEPRKRRKGLFRRDKMR